MIGDTIVVVDDEPDLLSLVQELLEDEGYQVLTVNNPAGIDQAIAQHEPALFLIDIMLPSMSGIALAESLRKTGYGSVPMVATSASPVMVQYAALSGWFSSTIDKPFDLDHVIGRVQAHLNG